MTRYCNFEQLHKEHIALMKEYGQVQNRVSQVISEQAATIRRLEAEVMKLRAVVIARDSELAWARDSMDSHTPKTTFKSSLFCVLKGLRWSQH